MGRMVWMRLRSRGETRVSELNDGLIETYNISSQELLGETYAVRELIGGGPQQNAEIAKNVLSGSDGACRKIVLLNAALAIVAGEKAGSVPEGIEVAKDCLDSGAALKKLEALRELTNSVK